MADALNVRYRKITGPSSPVVTLAQVKADLRVMTTFYDTLLQDHLNSAIAEFDGLLSRSNRVLGAQTYEVLISTPAQRFRVPLPDLISVTKVEYVEPSTLAKTDKTSIARFIKDDDSVLFDLDGVTWTGYIDVPNVVVTVQIGADPVPANAAAVIKMRVRQLWAGNDPTTEKAIDRACASFRRVPGVATC